MKLQSSKRACPFIEVVPRPRGLRGTNSYIGKIVSLVFSERVVGGMFEQGLAKLKTIAES